MIFNIKDIKSWSNRHDAKVGDKGYFFNDIDNAKNDDCYCKPVRGTVEYIRDNYCYCFGIDKRGLKENYSFFLPLDAVKKAKQKEKKYRPIRKVSEFIKCGVIKGDCLIDTVLTLRDKKNYNLTRDMKIIDVEYDFDIVTKINGFTLDGLFRYFDIYIDDEWRPFGIEVKENE